MLRGHYFFVPLTFQRDKMVNQPRKNGKGKATAAPKARAPRAPRGRRFAVTLNNPTDKEKEHLKNLETNGDLRYIVLGNEKGEDKNTPHLQGYVELKTQVPLHLFKKWFGSDRVHVEFAKSSAEVNIQYCKKEGDLFFEFGKPAAVGGESKANAFEAWKAAIRDHASWNDVLDDDKLQAPLAKYPAWVATQFGRRAVVERLDAIEFQRWQAVLVDRCAGSPDDRKIHVVVDKIGQRGKSWLTYLMVAHLGATILGNKDADAAYAWQGERVVIFDVAKSRVGDINWGLVEKIKDGLLFSAKYQSGKKMFSKPHVLVFMNDDPPLSAMSLDRWDIVELTDAGVLDFTRFAYKWDAGSKWYNRVTPTPSLVRQGAILLEETEEEDLTYSGPSSPTGFVEESQFDDVD